MKPGDFVQIEYVGRVKETGIIFDLTDDKLAKEKGIFNPKAKYGPVTIILGANQILKGFDEQIQKMNVKDKKTVIVEAKQAFGDRDQRLVKLFPLSHFKKQGNIPVPGQFITLKDNIRGRVLSVAGGRVRVDFNHPLAGKTLEYDVNVNKIITDKKEQINSVFEFYCGFKSEGVKIDTGKAKIQTPGEKTIPSEIKKRIADDITKYVKHIKEVEFTESFKKLSEK